MSMTRTSAIVGSPVYMSPEQMQASKGVDARTDVWALGIILFELLTGSVPFDSATVTELAIRVAIEPPPPVSRYRKDIPPRLEQLIFKCLEKQREQRFQNVGELALALLEFGSSHARASVDRILGTLKSAGMVARAPDEPDVRDSIPAPRAAGPSVATAAAWGSGTLATHRGKTAIAAAGAVGALALVGALLLLRKGPAPAQPPAAANLPALAQPSAALPTTQAPAPAPASAAAATPGPPSPPTPTPAPGRGVGAGPPPPPSPAQRPSTAKPASRGPGAPAIAPAGAASPAAPKARNCDPPYTIDADGNRVFKKECL
jgi:serine/threonine-protein kinase